MNEIAIASTDAEIAACFDVVRQLRPALDRETFVARVRLQESSQGYRLAALSVAGGVVCAAGYRLLETLAYGRVLYVDDLVTDKARRSSGFGEAMFEWLTNEARRLGCDELQLDSGVQRFRAHRFYFLRRMHATAYHFRLDLRSDASG